MSRDCKNSIRVDIRPTKIPCRRPVPYWVIKAPGTNLFLIVRPITVAAPETARKKVAKNEVIPAAFALDGSMEVSTPSHAKADRVVAITKGSR